MRVGWTRSTQSRCIVEFDLIPPQFSGLLGQVKVQVSNWHVLAPKEDPKRSVVKRGRESDAAFCRRVLDRPGPHRAGPGPQRRGPPRVPVPAGPHRCRARTPRTCARQPCGSTALSASTGTGASCGRSTCPQHPCTRRLQGPGLDAVRVDRLRLRPGRRHRIGAGEDPAHAHRRRRRPGDPEIPQPLGAHQDHAPEAVTGRG